MEAGRYSVALLAGLGLFIAPVFVFAGDYGAGDYGAAAYAGVPATVTTQPASSLTQTSATLNGTIAEVGTTSPSVRGFVYGADITYGATTTDDTGPFSVGPFSASVSSLTCGSTYHFAAYATSTDGIGYGSDVSFTTSPCPVVVTSSGGGGGGGGGSTGGSSGITAPVPQVLGASIGPIASAGTIETTTTSASSSVATSTAVIAPNAVSIASLQAEIIALEAEIAGLSPKGQATSTAFTRNLTLNMNGADVRALQSYLNTHGFRIAQSGSGSPGHETTFFGAATYRALIGFQKSKGLPATGYFGPLTRAAVAGTAN